MLIIGIQSVDFDTKEGRHISGYNIYYGDSIENGVGIRTNKVFLSVEKMQKDYYTYLQNQVECYGVVGLNGKINGFVPMTDSH